MHGSTPVLSGALRTVITAGVALALVLSTGGCALNQVLWENPTTPGSGDAVAPSSPEGTSGDDEAAETPDDSSDAAEEEIPEKPAPDSSGWGQTSDRDDPALKHPALPADFPRKRFPLPSGAVIEDAGARGGGAWFVVLHAKSAKQARTWWRAVIADGKFKVADEETNDGDLSARLVKKTLEVEALTIAQDDGSVLLSYDLNAR
ncbi:MAG: hypothetical protein KDB25_10110 [Leucobacter sp.]|nr:hypothetical protein [Leucobacter sp.]